MKSVACLVVIFIVASSALVLAQYPGPGRVTGDTIHVHDPTVAKHNGQYLLASTGDNIPLRTSTDRTHWTFIGAAFPGGMPWCHPYTKGSSAIWAPDLHRQGDLFYMYYSCSSFASAKSGIFLATSPTGQPGTWEHRGMVIESNGRQGFNAIDPNLLVDPKTGQWWMSFGSFWTGIKMIELDPRTGLAHPHNKRVYDLAFRPTRESREHAIEAPCIVHRGKYYYLFVSFDFCCKGVDSTYRIMVGRSESPTGPYVDRNGKPMMDGGGTQLLASHGNIHGPGHNSVLFDPEPNQWVLFYHYYTATTPPSLGINLLSWGQDDWPTVF